MVISERVGRLFVAKIELQPGHIGRAAPGRRIRDCRIGGRIWQGLAAL